LDPVGPEKGALRVLRGGGWYGDRDGARCAYRFRGGPAYFSLSIGFRVVCFPGNAFESLDSGS
jgi:formylglycine-generating enzyme required for sulfatase activity